jgi:hypothetical protein
VILPTKHISPEDSLLGVGSVILKNLRREQTPTRLWERVRSFPNVGNFERFVLALDLLYALDAIEVEDGLIRRSGQ